MTTPSEDLEARVNNPSWYTSHPSGIACVELIEHLPCNLANAVKYIWRCGLKTTEAPLRDLKAARWYVERERERVELYDLDSDPPLRTDILWRALARKVINSEADTGGALGDFLVALLDGKFGDMIDAIDRAIEALGVP